MHFLRPFEEHCLECWNAWSHVDSSVNIIDWMECKNITKSITERAFSRKSNAQLLLVRPFNEHWWTIFWANRMQKMLPCRLFPRSSSIFPSFRVWFCQTLPIRKKLNLLNRWERCVSSDWTSTTSSSTTTKLYFSDLWNGNAVLIRYHVVVLEVESLGHAVQTGLRAQVRWVRHVFYMQHFCLNFQ